MSLRRHPLIPDHVRVIIPRDRAEADAVRAEVRQRLLEWMSMMDTRDDEAAYRAELRQRVPERMAGNGSRPSEAALDFQVHGERKVSWQDGFCEQRVSYAGEPGEVIPAYLLIPAHGTPPFAAVVANHQCNVDCDVGKEAVVGKAYLRPDQAYGFELALRGFVVLAPESINCGERAVQTVRRPGERDKTKCWGRSFRSYRKHLWDAVRAVDVIEHLEFVDSRRIGMIGHSLGAGTTFWATAYDNRIRAGVASCHFLGGLSEDSWGQGYFLEGPGIYYHELLSLIAPRGMLATRGSEESPLSPGDFDTPAQENAAMEWAYALGQHVCDLYGAPHDRMQMRRFVGGHCFPEAERLYAYEWLAQQLAVDGW